MFWKYDLWVSTTTWIGLRWQEKNYEWEEYQDDTWQYSWRHSGDTRRQWMWRFFGMLQQECKTRWSPTHTMGDMLQHQCKTRWTSTHAMSDSLMTMSQFPRLTRMVRQYLSVLARFASPERLFNSVGLVKSDLWGRLWTPPWLTWCGLNKHPKLNLKVRKGKSQTHTHCTYTRQYM